MKSVRPSHTVRTLAGGLRSRFKLLAAGGGYTSEWRRLQFDAVQAVVESQRELVALHGEILAILRADRSLYQQLRLESIELGFACDSIRELIREIETAMHGLEKLN
jgi:hypothetical protein